MADTIKVGLVENDLAYQEKIHAALDGMEEIAPDRVYYLK